jgi:glycerophosphoryl diester phosphodiesterase
MEHVLFGGHRGSGCTDSAHARSSPARAGKPPENTLDSIAWAFAEGADFVEVDVLRTKDDVLVVTHSNRLADHVLREVPPAPHVGDLEWRDVAPLRTGPEGNGQIPTLDEVLNLVEELTDGGRASDFVLNLEIKDVKDTDAPKHVPGRPSLVELLARKVRTHGLPVGRLVFSSFALSDLIALKGELPEARLGMLFDVPEYAGKEVYPAAPEAHARYLPFTPEALREAAREVRLEFAHPELHTLTPEAMRTVAELGLGLNCWALREPPPSEDRPAIALALRLAREHRVRLGLITDFVPELRAEVGALPRAPSPGSAR